MHHLVDGCGGVGGGYGVGWRVGGGVGPTLWAASSGSTRLYYACLPVFVSDTLVSPRHVRGFPSPRLLWRLRCPMPRGTQATADSSTNPCRVSLRLPVCLFTLAPCKSFPFSASRSDSAYVSAHSGLGFQPFPQGRLIFANRRPGFKQSNLRLRIQVLTV